MAFCSQERNENDGDYKNVNKIIEIICQKYGIPDVYSRGQRRQIEEICKIFCKKQKAIRRDGRR